MDACYECPGHTFSTPSRTTYRPARFYLSGYRCDLYDLYNIDQRYLLNMHKFDSTRNATVGETKNIRRTGSFFGPFRNSARSSVFFLSLQRAAKFDADKYEFQHQHGTLDRGHVFALVSAPEEETETQLKTHYRVRRNLGSKLTGIDVKAMERQIVLEFGDGDYCQGMVRHRTKVILMCNKNRDAFSEVLYIEDEQDSIVVSD